MTVDHILQNGYKEYPDDTHRVVGVIRRSFQKIIQNEDGSKNLYFINVRAWKFPDQENVTFDCDVHFYQPDDGWFCVQLQEPKSIQHVEQFHKDMYERMECIPDVHNND